METPKFITVKEAAHLLRIQLNHLYICMRDGRGPPHINAGGVYRIPHDAFWEWVENGGTKTKISRGAAGKPKHKKDSKSCIA